MNITIEGDQGFNLTALEQMLEPEDFIKFTTFAMEELDGTDNYFVNDLQEISMEEYLEMKTKIEKNYGFQSCLSIVALMGLVYTSFFLLNRR